MPEARGEARLDELEKWDAWRAGNKQETGHKEESLDVWVREPARLWNVCMGTLVEFLRPDFFWIQINFKF
ncbi:hypothetical protein TIFTF001_037685 [Ficus carica]|uniref:Uncharacterized protein n=1 Tax=Ficus carica TaxID=3494 RepID=A0AA88JC33_FICCA|nr:hypothetical protein TIFTF001_037685 [Ficus carica]